MKSEEIKKLADTERDLAVKKLHSLFKFDENVRCDAIVDVVDHIIKSGTLRTIEYQAEALERHKEGK